MISIISLNRFSIAYHQAFLWGDLRAAKRAIGAKETKSEPDTLAQLEELEFALTAEYPYKLLARFYQVVATKSCSQRRSPPPPTQHS